MSFSGELAAQARRLFMEYGLRGEAHVTKQADVFALKYGEIVSSSDAVLIDKAVLVVDLARQIGRRRSRNKLLSLEEVEAIAEK